MPTARRTGSPCPPADPPDRPRSRRVGAAGLATLAVVGLTGLQLPTAATAAPQGRAAERPAPTAERVAPPADKADLDVPGAVRPPARGARASSTTTVPPTKEPDACAHRDARGARAHLLTLRAD